MKVYKGYTVSVFDDKREYFKLHDGKYLKISAYTAESARRQFEQIAFNAYFTNWNQFQLTLRFSPIYVEEA